MPTITELLQAGQSSAAGAVPGASEALAAVQQVAQYLPPGKLRDAYTSGIAFIPGGLLISLLKKKQFMSGEYWLGEKYMYHVLGRTDINKRSKVPDEFVKPAQYYFSETLGVPIITMDDLYALMEGWVRYLDRDPAEKLRERVTVAQAQRAYVIAKQFPESTFKWDFEAASLALPVQTVPVVTQPANVLTNQYTATPGASLSTADNPQALEGVTITPRWWDTNKLLVCAVVLLLVIAGVFAWKKSHKNRW